jgi:HJR/Mrr/RecB family endonuclease
MADYDFHELSPMDFENLTRDLLQKEWGIRLETFKMGRDGGIDLRYATGSEKLVVQCKHYVRTGFSGLLRSVRSEAIKVQRLQPTRYVLVTSTPLSPDNKTEIVKAIGPQILQALACTRFG